MESHSLETAKEIERAEPGLVGQGLHFLSVAGLMVALATYLFNLWVSRRVPSLSADSLIYHLTIPAYWMERGFLQTPDLPFHDGAAEHSPLFTETIIYGLMGLTGNDDLAFLVQPTFFLLLVAVFHWSVRQLGLAATAGRFLAALVLLFAPFFHSSLIVNSEMVMTCGVALFVYGMLLTRERREAGWYVAAVGISLALAAKTVGVIYGLLAVMILVGAMAAERTADVAERRRFWLKTGSICGAIIFCGLAFHWHNLWKHGNPLYPAELRMLGMPILPGRYDASVLRNHGWSLAALGKMLLWDSEAYAMPKQFGGILWLAMGTTLGMLALRRLRREDVLPSVLFVFYPLASVLVYFAVVPFWSEHRLLFPVYYLLWGGLGWSLQLLTRERTETIRELAAGVLGLMFVAHACFFLLFDEVPLLLLVAAAVLGIVMANYPSILKWIGERPWVIPAATMGVLIISSPWWYTDLARQRAKGRGSAYAQMYGRSTALSSSAPLRLTTPNNSG
ncbi:MAG: glycosyltransferase family 39 protein [Planctomycetales bacterium]|nr:glycosyltransferase family 39 protein [Planctomycetales bacterium]